MPILVHTYVRSWSLGCTEVSSGLGRYRNRSATRKLLESLNTTVTLTSRVVSSWFTGVRTVNKVSPGLQRTAPHPADSVSHSLAHFLHFRWHVSHTWQPEKKLFKSRMYLLLRLQQISHESKNRTLNTLVHNFAKCSPICKILSPPDLAVNCNKVTIADPTLFQRRRYLTPWNLTVQ